MKIELTKHELFLIRSACANEFVKNRFQDAEKADKYEKLDKKLLKIIDEISEN